MGRPFDFVLHNAGSHHSDATALNIRPYANVLLPAAQADVTGKVQVQAKFHTHLITPLGSYPQRFGKAAPGEKQTLKVKVHHWRDGVVKHLEFPHASALDLAPK